MVKKKKNGVKCCVLDNNQCVVFDLNHAFTLQAKKLTQPRFVETLNQFDNHENMVLCNAPINLANIVWVSIFCCPAATEKKLNNCEE